MIPGLDSLIERCFKKTGQYPKEILLTYDEYLKLKANHSEHLDFNPKELEYACPCSYKGINLVIGIEFKY